MDAHGQSKYGSHIQRQLAALKVISRLLGHELHSQTGTKAITLSREEVVEIQTTLDMFIEVINAKLGAQTPAGVIPTAETHLVPARN